MPQKVHFVVSVFDGTRGIFCLETRILPGFGDRTGPKGPLRPTNNRNKTSSRFSKDFFCVSNNALPETHFGFFSRKLGKASYFLRTDATDFHETSHLGTKT
jgi:hypothetical protein